VDIKKYTLDVCELDTYYEGYIPVAGSCKKGNKLFQLRELYLLMYSAVY
jgi:hypothetical protein